MGAVCSSIWTHVLEGTFLTVLVSGRVRKPPTPPSPVYEHHDLPRRMRSAAAGGLQPPRERLWKGLRRRGPGPGFDGKEFEATRVGVQLVVAALAQRVLSVCDDGFAGSGQNTLKRKHGESVTSWKKISQHVSPGVREKIESYIHHLGVKSGILCDRVILSCVVSGQQRSFLEDRRRVQFVPFERSGVDLLADPTNFSSNLAC